MSGKLRFRGSYDVDVIDGVVTLPPGILTRGIYDVLHNQDGGYRSLGIRKIPVLRIVKGFLGRDTGDIATWVEDTLPIPKASLDFLGLFPNDKVLLLPSLDYSLSVWEMNEFLRYNSTISEQEMLQFMDELGMDSLRRHYNNPPAQSGRRFPGF